MRAWDMAAAVPRLLDTVPFNSGGAGAKLRRVTAMQVVAYIVAHCAWPSIAWHE